FLLRASGIDGSAARLCDLAVLLIPVRRPLPNVAGHVVKPVAVRGKTAHRRDAFESVGLKVLPGKFSLPTVRHIFACGGKFIAPGKFSSRQSASRGELPLGFGW